MIRLTKEADDATLRVTNEEFLGTIKYVSGRDNPWQAVRGNTMQYFKEQHQALEYVVKNAK